MRAPHRPGRRRPGSPPGTTSSGGLFRGGQATLFALALVGCIGGGDWAREWALTAPCRLAAPGAALPPAVRESSGVQPVHGHDSLFWTHNDSGGEPRLYLVGLDGRDRGQVRVLGARNRDWEDLGAGPCAQGDRCLYIADTGDNREERDDPAIYRIVEPEVGDTVSAPARRFPLRFPRGPRDVEALYILPGERLFLITKGRNHPLEVYRVPPLPPEDGAPHPPLELEHIQDLSPGPVFLPRMVTGAGATPDGGLVAVRTYESLLFHRPDPVGRLQAVPGGFVNLRPLREMQGEAVAWAGGDRWVLSSEGGPGISRGSIHLLACSVP